MKLKTKDITIGAVLIALMISTLWISIPMVPVPITLQTMMVLIIALLLEKKVAILTICTYITMGLIGLPVYSNYSSGITPAFGYIIGFFFATVIISFVKDYCNKYTIYVLTIGCSMLILLCGSLGLVILADYSLNAAIVYNLNFIPGDIIKSIVAVIVYYNVSTILENEE